jgi:LysM repeat protein
MRYRLTAVFVAAILVLPATAGAVPLEGPLPEPETYTVKDGDTLADLAERFEVTVARLVELNRIPDQDYLETGFELRLTGPRSATKAPAPPEGWGQPAPTSAAGPSLITSTSGGYVGGSSYWDAVMECESGNHGGWSLWSTGNGYYFALQFAPGTWLAFGGPSEYLETPGLVPSRSLQIAVAERTQAGSQNDPWPNCP